MADMLYRRAARVETEEERRARNSEFEDVEFEDEPFELPSESIPVDANANATPNETSGDSKDSQRTL